MSDRPAEPKAEAGWVDDDVAAEFPELRLLSMSIVPGVRGRSPREVRSRLKGLSDRIGGMRAISMRQEPITWAYRVFYRHVGLDPDADRTPLEAATLERLLRGRFAPQGLPADALTIALVETGVPIWALDADRVAPPLGLRPARGGELLGSGDGALPLPVGRLVVADAERPVAVTFGDVSPDHVATRSTPRLTLFTVRPAGVPAIHVEEALWIAAETLGAGGP